MGVPLRSTMKKAVLATILFMTSSSLAQKPAVPKKTADATAKAIGKSKIGPSVEGVTEYNWPNGFKALLIPDGTKSTVSVNLTVLAGSRQEDYGQHGMAHLFEHMLFKRTKKYASVKDELSKLGGHANGTTWVDRTNYYETFQADDARLAKAIDLEAQRLRSAIVSKDELQTEMTVVKNELERGENSPFGSTYRRLLSAAYTWHNYGKSTIGPVSDIVNVPNESLLKWYETFYQPDNAVLIVAGKFDPAKALANIDSTFGAMPRPKRVLPRTYTVEPIQDGEKYVSVRRTGGEAITMAAYHIASAADPDTAALSVLNEVLGNNPSGRLYKALVDSGKAAAVNCEDSEYYDPGHLICLAQFKGGQATAPARDAMLAAMENFAPATEEETSRAKSSILKNYALILNDTQRIAGQLSEFVANSDWRYLFLTRDRVEAVTSADIDRVAKKYLKQSNRTLAEYIPTDKPDRTEVADRPNIGAPLANYAGKAVLAAGEDFAATPRNIEARTKRATLPSGMKIALLSKKTRGETVRFAMTIGLGSEAALAGQRMAGETALEMLTRGTTKRTRQQIQDALNNLKAELSIDLRKQDVVVKLEVRRGELLPALDILAECLRTPSFDAKEFQSLVGELTAQVEQQRDDPSYVAQTRLQQAVAPWKATQFLYTMTPVEELAALKTVKVTDASAFHGRFFGAGAATVAVVGDFDEDAVKAKLSALFDGWTAKEQWTRIPEPFVKPAAGLETLVVQDKPMGMLAAGLLLNIRDDNADVPALTMADFLLGGGFLKGRIPQRLREKEGLSYGAGSRFVASPLDERSLIFGYAIFAAKNLDKVLAGFKEEIQKAQASGFTDAELTGGKTGILQERATRRASDGYIAETLAAYLRFDRTFDYDEKLDEKLSALSLSQVNAAAKKYLDFDSMKQVTAGDFKK